MAWSRSARRLADADTAMRRISLSLSSNLLVSSRVSKAAQSLPMLDIVPILRRNLGSARLCIPIDANTLQCESIREPLDKMLLLLPLFKLHLRSQSLRGHVLNRLWVRVLWISRFNSKCVFDSMCTLVTTLKIRGHARPRDTIKHTPEYLNGVSTPCFE